MPSPKLRSSAPAPGSAKRKYLALAALAAAVASASPARAGDRTWDNGAANFNWDTSSLNWTTGLPWNNSAGDGAIFGPIGVGTINLPAPINVNSLNFTVNGYALSGSGPLTFVNGTSTQTTGVVNVGAGTAQINVPINSAVGFQKIGPGVLQLSGPGSYTAAIPIDARGSTTAGLIIGGTTGSLDGGTLRVMNSSVIPASTNVSIGTGYLDIGSNNLVINNLTFNNQNLSKPWDTTLNANNGVVGSGTLRVTGDINVIGVAGGNAGNAIATDFDLGGGTQVIRTGVASSFGLHSALMFTGDLSNGSLLKTIGYNFNGVQANTDGIGLYGNNTYTGSTVLNGGQSLMAGTNATSSIKLTGAFGAAGVTVLTLGGANGSAQGATLIQSFEGATLLLDNNATFGAAPPGGLNQPFVPAAQNNDRIRDDAEIQLRSGNFTYRGLTGSTTASETFGDLNVLAGHNTVTIQPNNLGAATVTGSDLTMAPRSTLALATVTTGTGNSGNAIGGNAQLKFSGTVPAGDATGILPRVVSAADFLTYNAATGLTPYTGYAGDFLTAGTNVSIAAGTTVASSVDINALRSTSGSATALTIGASQTLGIDSGMILNSGFGALTISGSTMDFGSNPGVLFGTGNIILSGPVTGSGGLISARGTNTLSGDFSGLTGSVDVLSGTANITTNTLFSPINHRNGTLNINVSQTAAGLGAITLGNSETAQDVTGLAPSINISGAGANAIINRDLIVDNGAKTAAGVALRYPLYPGLTPTGNANSQTWSGDITLNTGLRLQGGGPSGTNTGATIFSGDISGSDRFFIFASRATFSGTYSNAGGFLVGDQGQRTNVSFTGTGSGNGPMLISGGNTNTMSYEAGALQSGPISVWNSSSGTAPQIIPLENSTINNQIILGIGSNPGQEGDAIANVGSGITAEWAGPISGFSPLTKTGTGTLVLSSSSSTHTGPMSVSAGTLRINGDLPSSGFTIASGATLDGTGTASGSVTVNTGGSLAPGNSVGQLDIGSLTLQGNLLAEIDLNNGAAPFADLLDVSGTTTLSNATLNLLVQNLPAVDGGGVFLLVDNDGVDAVNGTFTSITGLPVGLTATLDYAFSGTDSMGRIGTGNDIAVTLVPEPGTAALGLAGALLLLRRRRRV